MHLGAAMLTLISRELYNTFHGGLKVVLEEHLREFLGWINAE